ncbi:amidohydrolase family protein [bacterium]|nr:amidohydrolase family protein [bacterium]
MGIDAHQHFWIYSPEEYPWIGPNMVPLRRDFQPEDLGTLLAAAGLNHSVAVQARQSLDETRWLLELAAGHPVIHGVVGWVDLRSPEVDAQLAEFADHPKFVGVRHVVQDEPDDRFLLQPDFIRGLKLLPKYGLTYDLLVYPKQLSAAVELAQLLPEQPFVLDHIAKPIIREGTFQPWANQIRELAQCPNVHCKVSGMVTEADWENWKDADFIPYLNCVFEAFGEDRLMYGSDWPVCLAAAEYAQVVKLLRDYVRIRCPEAEERIFGGNAEEFYTRRLPV